MLKSWPRESFNAATEDLNFGVRYRLFNKYLIL